MGRETSVLDGIKIVKESIGMITDKLLADFYFSAQEELKKRKAFAHNQALVDPRVWAREKEKENKKYFSEKLKKAREKRKKEHDILPNKSD